jgi:hypothetical protein
LFYIKFEQQKMKNFKLLETLVFALFIEDRAAQINSNAAYCSDANYGLSEDFALSNVVETASIRNCVYMCLIRCNKMPLCETVVFSNASSTCQFFKRTSLSNMEAGVISSTVYRKYTNKIEIRSNSTIIVNMNSGRLTALKYSMFRFDNVTRHT